jgi:DNA protecting protein DprA
MIQKIIMLNFINNMQNVEPNIDIKSDKFQIFYKKDFASHFLFKRFLEIPDCPEKIYVKGSMPGPHMHTVAIVGSRALTSYGKDAVEKLVEGLAGYSVSVISGLALGTDAEAHKNALKNNLHTIAVPGSGLAHNVIYPRTNYDLAVKILESGGLLLSEFEPDQASLPWTFPMRNRLMATLADVVLIVEASYKSGTMITARLALEYNREVLAVPGSIFSKTSEGTNRLISQGAKIVTCSEDILEALGINVEREDEMVNSHDGGTEMSNWKKAHYEKRGIDLSVKKENKKIEKNLDEMKDLTDTEKEILANAKEPITKDKLIAASERDIGDILMTLTLLEMRGYIKEEGGMIRRVR